MFAGQSYLWGPLTILVVVGVLAMTLRWVYGTARAIQQPPAEGDFGLLREVAMVGSVGEANALRAVLGDAGIRSTIIRPPDAGLVIVMVFQADLEQARRVVGPR